MTWALPEKDIEYRLAVQPLAQPAQMQLKILEAFMGQRQTFGELRPILKGRNNNDLTKALFALGDRGLIQAALRDDLKTKVYRLSSLGKLVLLRSHEMLPHHLSIEAYQRGIKALG